MMKKLIVVLALALMISGSVLSASAVENQVVEQSSENGGTIVPIADKIVTKFRV